MSLMGLSHTMSQSASNTSGSSHPFLHARQRVGSSHAPVNYTKAERAFHASDVPARAREAVVEINLALPERNATRWKSETSLGRHYTERKARQISAFDQTEYEYNFRAEVLPKPRPVETDTFGRIKRVVLVSHWGGEEGRGRGRGF